MNRIFSSCFLVLVLIASAFSVTPKFVKQQVSDFSDNLDSNVNAPSFANAYLLSSFFNPSTQDVLSLMYFKFLDLKLQQQLFQEKILFDQLSGDLKTELQASKKQSQEDWLNYPLFYYVFSNSPQERQVEALNDYSFVYDLPASIRTSKVSKERSTFIYDLLFESSNPLSEKLLSQIKDSNGGLGQAYYTKLTSLRAKNFNTDKKYILDYELNPVFNAIRLYDYSLNQNKNAFFPGFTSTPNLGGRTPLTINNFDDDAFFCEAYVLIGENLRKKAEWGYDDNERHGVHLTYPLQLVLDYKKSDFFYRNGRAFAQTSSDATSVARRLPKGITDTQPVSGRNPYWLPVFDSIDENNNNVYNIDSYPLTSFVYSNNNNDPGKTAYSDSPYYLFYVSPKYAEDTYWREYGLNSLISFYLARNYCDKAAFKFQDKYEGKYVKLKNFLDNFVFSSTKLNPYSLFSGYSESPIEKFYQGKTEGFIQGGYDFFAGFTTPQNIAIAFATSGLAKGFTSLQGLESVQASPTLFRLVGLGQKGSNLIIKSYFAGISLEATFEGYNALSQSNDVLRTLSSYDGGRFLAGLVFTIVLTKGAVKDTIQINLDITTYVDDYIDNNKNSPVGKNAERIKTEVTKPAFISRVKSSVTPSYYAFLDKYSGLKNFIVDSVNNLIDNIAENLNLEERPVYAFAGDEVSLTRESKAFFDKKNENIMRSQGNSRSSSSSSKITDSLTEAYRTVFEQHPGLRNDKHFMNELTSNVDKLVRQLKGLQVEGKLNIAGKLEEVIFKPDAYGNTPVNFAIIQDKASVTSKLSYEFTIDSNPSIITVFRGQVKIYGGEQEYLPASQAVQRIQEDGQLVLDAFKGRPIHEIPIKELTDLTAQLLFDQGRYAKVWYNNPISDSRGAYNLLPQVDGRVLYSYYDLGHFIYRERTISELKSQGLIKDSQTEELFRQLFGYLDYSAPKSIKQQQMNAFNSLISSLGENQFEQLLQAASKSWMSNFGNRLSITAPFSDGFDNSANYISLNPNWFTRDETTFIQHYRNLLTSSLKEPKSSFYYDDIVPTSSTVTSSFYRRPPAEVADTYSAFFSKHPELQADNSFMNSLTDTEAALISSLHELRVEGKLKFAGKIEDVVFKPGINRNLPIILDLIEDKTGKKAKLSYVDRKTKVLVTSFDRKATVYNGVSEYLPVSSAVSRIQADVQLVLSNFKDKPIDQVSLKDITDYAEATLYDSGRYVKLYFNDNLHAPTDYYLISVENGRSLYSRYELSYFIYKQRMLSALEASDAVLSGTTETGSVISNQQVYSLLDKALGDLSYSVPKSVIQRQLSALNELIILLGTDKTEALLKEASNLWNRELQNSNGLTPHFNDAFKNPANNQYLSTYLLLPGETLLSHFKELLKRQLTPGNLIYPEDPIETDVTSNVNLIAKLRGVGEHDSTSVQDAFAQVFLTDAAFSDLQKATTTDANYFLNFIEQFKSYALTKYVFDPTIEGKPVAVFNVVNVRLRDITFSDETKGANYLYIVFTFDKHNVYVLRILSSEGLTELSTNAYGVSTRDYIQSFKDIAKKAPESIPDFYASSVLASFDESVKPLSFDYVVKNSGGKITIQDLTNFFDSSSKHYHDFNPQSKPTQDQLTYYTYKNLMNNFQDFYLNAPEFAYSEEQLVHVQATSTLIRPKVFFDVLRAVQRAARESNFDYNKYQTLGRTLQINQYVNLQFQLFLKVLRDNPNFSLESLRV